MSACEVITWIAFRRAIPHDQLGTLFKVTSARWFCVPADNILEALEARAGLSGDGCFCAIRNSAVLPDLDRYHSRPTIFTSEGPRALRWIRAQHRREAGNLLSFADLARLLRAEMAFDDEIFAQIEEGKKRLRDRVAGGLLTAYGIPLRADGSRAAGALPQAIPATLFMHPAITQTEWDTLAASANRPPTEWRDQSLPRFEEIQFRTAEILRLWPPHFVPRQTSERANVDSCTLTDATGRVAYGNDYHGRYFAPPGDAWAEGEKRHRRRLDMLYPSNSGLPGMSAIMALEENAREMALAAWKQADRKRWSDAEAALSAALLAGKLKAFDDMGLVVPPEFWLANNLRGLRARAFRVRAADLGAAGLLPSGATAPATPLDEASPLPNRLPPELASDQHAAASFEAMKCYATDFVRQRGAPPARDDAARAANKKYTAYPVRKARGLYRYLPAILRNPSRARRQ